MSQSTKKSKKLAKTKILSPLKINVSKIPKTSDRSLLICKIFSKKFRVRIGRPLEYQIKTRRTLMSEKIEEMNLHQKFQ